MYNEIISLRERYCNAKTDAEREQIDIEMKALAEKDGNAFGEAMVKAARETADRAEALVIKSKMKEVLPAISISYIAKTYFNKSRQWMYQRLNGSVVNGKPTNFTLEEVEILKKAMVDLGDKISSVSTSL